MAVAGWRFSNLKFKILVGLLITCLLITLFIGLTPIPNNFDKPNGKLKSLHVTTEEEYEINSKDEHRLGIIVPFRDRFEELLEFVPYIHRFLKLKEIKHEIIVVNQIDTHRFNRASLINIGFLYATNSEPSSTFKNPCDYIAMHDVDLLPLNNDLPYDFPEKGTVTHVAASGLHPKYDYASFIGGILLVPVEIFKQVDGMSNVYWGWGLEDDEFYVRLKQQGILVKRPSGLTTGKTNTFRHTHSPKIRPRDMERCYDQHNKTRKRDRKTGLANVNYTLESVSHLHIEQVPLIVLNVRVHCNTQLSPWCDCPAAKENKSAQQKSLKKQTINSQRKISKNTGRVARQDPK